MSFLFPLIVGLVPSFVWLYFFLREDEAYPEPKRLLIYVFLSGAATTFFVFGPQFFLSEILGSLNIATMSIFGMFLLAGIEELFKFIAVYVTVAGNKEFDEPLDAMIYMIVASLGFAAMENIASAAQWKSIFLPQALGPVEVTSLRFIGATLLHSLSSALVGYYWGMAMAKRAATKARVGWLIAEGIGVATLLHAVFNYLILRYKPENMVATLFLVAVAFFILNDFEKLKQIEQQTP
ncbi:MAG: PrsW family intramembrane metalloprotease [Candidatus Harrisonbacteria bacterium]|nr:PrsW family intramembrane metalloprotease [Candidatus Harrisonbacteria bacterium]MBI2603961.1 PrsW family intramembrane metalloprotease [Candidatus Harrisonbacteria bacterium]